MRAEVVEVSLARLGIEELGAALGVDTRVVIEYVELGLIEPSADMASGRGFTATDVMRLSRALRLSRELELHAAAAVLLVELIEERERLARRVDCLERTLASVR